MSAVVDLAPAMPLYAEHFKRFEEWIAAGMAGNMGYLPRGCERRMNPLLVFPEAKSVFFVAVPYSAAPFGNPDPGKGPLLARYLRGPDYHCVIPERIERVLEACRDRFTSESDQPLKWKICVDTSAVLERAWCNLAGLGWIGKNSMLIHPVHGSYLLLGMAFLNQETGVGPTPIRDRCGNCRKCLEACPAGALLGEGKLDARRCISYWTLEKKGELALSPGEKKAVGRWVAGCDLCQEACPFNLKAAKRARPSHFAEPLAADPLEKSWEELFSESAEDYRNRVAGTALNRITPDNWRRNVELAHENASSVPEGSFLNLA